MKQIDVLVDQCLKKGFVSQDEAPLLRYALEKRIITLVTFVPMIILGLLITSPATVIGFFLAFHLLRTRTNGFHAKKIGQCILYSALFEIFFLWILPIFLSKSIAFVFLTISIILIWILAPYNHPNMNLSSDEARACEKSAKWRLMTLILFLNVSYVLKMIQFSLGILLGIILTALTLVMGYSM